MARVFSNGQLQDNPPPWVSRHAFCRGLAGSFRPQLEPGLGYVPCESSSVVGRWAGGGGSPGKKRPGRFVVAQWEANAGTGAIWKPHKNSYAEGYAPGSLAYSSAEPWSKTLGPDGHFPFAGEDGSTTTLRLDSRRLVGRAESVFTPRSADCEYPPTETKIKVAGHSATSSGAERGEREP